MPCARSSPGRSPRSRRSAGRNVTILFYEASTRTRVSFEVAAKNLSADVVNIAAATSSVTKGESLVDTVKTVEALGAQMLVMRHSVSGAPYLAAETFSGSVLNGGDGWHAHPTQALLDLYTLRARLATTTARWARRSLEGRKVVILGDILHSRVARSNIWTLTAAGADLWLCGPSTLLRGFEAWALRSSAAGRPFHVTASVDEALRDADVVMALRIQKERMASGLLPSLREYAARYGLTRERLALRPTGRARHASGPDERRRRDRAGRRGGDAVADRGAGPERGRGPDGPAVPARRGSRVSAVAAELGSSAGEIGAVVADLEISRAWLIDPASGREGPGEIVVSDGVLEAVNWLDAGEAEGIDDRGVVVAPGFVDLHVHLREPGNEDAETIATRPGRSRARRVHDGLRDAEHHAGARRSGGPRPGPRAAACVRLAGPRARLGRGHGRPRRRDARRPRRARRTPGSSGSRDDGAPVASATLMRNAIAYAGALGLPIVDHAEDPTLTAGAEANEGYVATVLGLRGWPAAAEEAAVARDLAMLAEVVRDVPAARLHLTHLSTAGALDLVRRAKARGLPVTCDVTPHHLALSDEWVAGARRWAGKADGDPWARWDGSARRGAVRDVAPRQSAAARAGGRGRLPGGARSTGPPTRSRRTTPRTASVDKDVEFGLAANGISGHRDGARAPCSRRSTPGCPARPGDRGADRGPARVLGAAGATGRRPVWSRARRRTSSCSIGRRRGPSSPDALASRGKNTPLLGRGLPGRVLGDHRRAAGSPTRPPPTETGAPAARGRRGAAVLSRYAPPRCRPRRRPTSSGLNRDYERRPYWHATMPALARVAIGRPAGHGRCRRHRRRLHRDQRGAGARRGRRGRHPPRGRTARLRRLDAERRHRPSRATSGARRR